jgi:hypothetical protein
VRIFTSQLFQYYQYYYYAGMGFRISDFAAVLSVKRDLPKNGSLAQTQQIGNT